jgi:hypothetical protein
MKNLKEEMSELNLTMKTDYETMRELIDKFKQTETNRADKLTILKDLEYYVHQVRCEYSKKCQL